MSCLFRFEYDIQTGITTRIELLTYKDIDGNILVLDEGIAPPEGYVEFDFCAETPDP